MSIGNIASEGVATETPEAQTVTDGIIAATLLLVEITDVLIDREEFVVVIFVELVLLVTTVDNVETVDEVPTSEVVDRGTGISTTIVDIILPAVNVVTAVVEFEGLATDVGVEQAAVVVEMTGGVVEAAGSIV